MTGRTLTQLAGLSFVCAAALPLTIGGSAGAAPARPDAASPPSPIQVENSLAGADPAEWLPPTYPPTRIEGYASETSVLPGESVRFHVSTAQGDRYRVEVYRLGWYGGRGARLLACLDRTSVV